MHEPPARALMYHQLGSTVKKTMRPLSFLAVLIPACCVAQTGNGHELVNAFIKNLNSAQALTVNYTAQVIGGVPQSFSVQLSKPNLAHIDTPWEEITADGKQITIYEKDGRTYYKQPETDSVLKDAMSDIYLKMWQPFFDANAMSAAPDIEDSGPAKIRGISLEKIDITVDPLGKWHESMYLDSAKLPHQFEIQLPDNHSIALVDTDDLQLRDTALPPDTFSFSPPSGSHELSTQLGLASKWYTDIRLACNVAALTNRDVMLVLIAPYSTAWQRLRTEVFSTEDFKKFSKYFVFCRMSVAEQPALPTIYRVQGIPAAVFMKPTTETILTINGYQDKSSYLAAMDAARKAAGFKR